MSKRTNTSIKEYIKNVSIRNLLFPVIVLIIILFLLIAVPISKVLSPKKVTSIDEIKNLYKENNHYCEFSFDELCYTGYDYFDAENRNKASYYYVLDDSENPSCLFFLIPVENTDNKSAILYNYSARAILLKNNAQTKAFLTGFSSDIEWDSTSLENISGGFLVSEYNYSPNIYIVIAILIILIGGCCLVYLIVNVLFILFPHLYPACARLKRFGLDNLDFREIDAELKHNWLIKEGDFRITDNYLIAFGKNDFWMIPLFNIIWAYNYSEKNLFSKKNPFNYCLVIITSPKDKITIRVTDRESTETILNYLRTNFAQIAVGYSDDIREKMDRLI